MAPAAVANRRGRSYIARRSSGEALQSAAHLDDLFEQRRQCRRESSDEFNFSLWCSLLRRKSQPMAGARREAPNKAFREEHDDQGGTEGRQKDAERDNQRHYECREARRRSTACLTKAL